jgi:hypothetical protein
VSKALKKLTKTKSRGMKRSASAAHRSRKITAARPAAKKQPPVTPMTQEPASAGQPSAAGPGTVEPTPASPPV